MNSKDKQLEETIGNKVEQIILNNYNKYYRLAYSYVHNEYDAADIVQNGAYQAIKNSDTLREEKYATSWIYRIMINEIFKCIKKNNEIPTDFLETETIMQEESSSSKLSFTDREALMEDQSYENLELKDAIEQMNAKDKILIELRFFEDYSLQEIADIMKVNINTVKSRLYRELKKLRIELEP